MAEIVKNPPVMWETWARSLGQEDPLEAGMATHSSTLAWRIPMDRGAWRATIHGVAKSQTQLSDLAQHSIGSGKHLAATSSIIRETSIDEVFF